MPNIRNLLLIGSIIFCGNYLSAIQTRDFLCEQSEGRSSVRGRRIKGTSSFAVRILEIPTFTGVCGCRASGRLLDQKEGGPCSLEAMSCSYQERSFEAPEDESLLPIYDTDIAIVANHLLNLGKYNRAHPRAFADKYAYQYLLYMFKNCPEQLLSNKLFQSFLHDYRRWLAIVRLENRLESEYGVYECNVSGSLGIFRELEKELPGVVAHVQQQPMNIFTGWQYSHWDFTGDFFVEKESVFTYETKYRQPLCTCNFQYGRDRKTLVFLPEKATEVRPIDLKEARDVLIEVTNGSYEKEGAVDYLAHMFTHHREELFANRFFKALVHDYRTFLTLQYIKKGLQRQNGHWMHASPKRLFDFEDVDTKAPGFLDAVKALPFTFPMSFEVPNAINN